jgi:flagellar basal body-associated protein FliL
MPEDEKNAESAAESAKKGGKKKLPIIVAGLMLLEGAAVFGLVKFLGGGPGEADAGLVGEELAGEQAPVEILLVSDAFQNMQTGRVWEWRVEIYLRVRQKNAEEVKRVQERDSATIKEGIALIFRRAHDRHLREPGLETIQRQVQTYVNETFGTDPDGIPRVDRVIISECKGFPADS